LSISDKKLVSCLMVSLATPKRAVFLKKSVSDYCAQTHLYKELIIIAPTEALTSPSDLGGYIDGLGRSDIRLVSVPAVYTLGQCRNVSLQVATGDIVCQWDDDDRFHPQRIERQLAFLLSGGFDACYLEDVMQFFPTLDEIYWTNWRLTEVSGHPGTLMMRRGNNIHYPSSGPEAKAGEDTAVARQLMAHHQVGFLREEPYLFIYVSHGGNTWYDSHHAMLAAELSISRGLLLRREALLRVGLSALELGPQRLSVMGKNGAAFEL
jgi:glycosyltransferase involved in cell wall biosynthesis